MNRQTDTATFYMSIYVGLTKASPNKHLGINAKAFTISVNSCMSLRI